MEIYGFDLKKAAELGGPGQLSAAAQRALDLYARLPEQDTTWKQQPSVQEKPKSKQQLQKEYFEIKEKEVTRELKQELQAIQLRQVSNRRAMEVSADLDSKVQFGTVIEGPAQFYSQRLVKKDRKKNMVDQLLSVGDEKLAKKLKEMKQQEQEERIARYKTKVHLNRRGAKHPKQPKQK